MNERIWVTHAYLVTYKHAYIYRYKYAQTRIHTHTHLVTYMYTYYIETWMSYRHSHTRFHVHTTNRTYIYLGYIHTYLVINTQTYIRNTHVCMHRLIPNNIQKYVGPTYCIAKTHQYIHI